MWQEFARRVVCASSIRECKADFASVGNGYLARGIAVVDVCIGVVSGLSGFEKERRKEVVRSSRLIGTGVGPVRRSVFVAFVARSGQVGLGTGTINSGNFDFNSLSV